MPVRASAITRRARTLPVLRLALLGDRPRDACGRRRSPATMPGYHLGRIPGNKGKRFGQDYLRPYEIQALLDACAKTNPIGRRTYALVVVLWRSGVRIHEALLLQEHHFDFDSQRITIERGKGGKPRRAQMDAWGFDQLRPWLDYRRDRYPAGPTFCVTAGPNKGIRAVGAPSVRVTLHDLAVRAKVTRRIHPHIFRHTLAVELMKDSMPLSYIQRALGHSNPATTATYLQGLGMDEGLEAVAQRPAPAFAGIRLEGSKPEEARDE